MKVCQILATDSQGGLVKHIRELSSCLGEDMDVVVICPSSVNMSLNKKVKRVDFDPKGTTSNLLNALKLLMLLKGEKPDIVHAHGNTAAVYVKRIKYFLSAKTIGTIHWNLKKKKNRRGYESLDGVIGVSENVLKDIKNPTKKRIYNGIPANSGEPVITKESIINKYLLDPTKPIGIAIGRMVKGKGFDILLRAWKGIPATLLLVGEGKLENDLKHLASELDLDKNVMFLGAIENASRLMAAVDFVVISSRSEGFSYILAEALINERPLVSTKVFGPKEILPDVALAECESYEDLHQKISVCVSSPKEYKDCFLELFSWAKEQLSIEAMVQNTIDFYHQILEK